MNPTHQEETSVHKLFANLVSGSQLNEILFSHISNFTYWSIYLISINPLWLQNYQGKIYLHFIQRFHLTHSLLKLLVNIISLNFQCSVIILWKYKSYTIFTKTTFYFFKICWLLYIFVYFSWSQWLDFVQKSLEHI